jgi:cell division protein FtsL
MTVLPLFIAILSVLCISIVFSILIWALQFKLSSRIAALEEKLQKKTLEFDALKKEHASLASSQKTAPVVEVAEPLEMPLQTQAINEGEIQIMRNVRGTFTVAESEEMPEQRRSPRNEGPLEATRVDDVHGFPPAITPASGRIPAAWQPRPVRFPAPAAQKPQNGGAIDAVIPLFSPVAQGPDFNNLYAALIELLKSGENRLIGFDFGGIQFLNDGELEYLEKIYRSLASQKRSLVLLNCSGTLTALLQRRPPLATLVRR